MRVVEEPDWIRSAISKYEQPLTLYALRILGDVERARDAVQETFLRLCSENPGNIDGHVAEWLFTVCRSRALDSQRKEKRMSPLQDVDARMRPSSEPLPAEAAERKETASLALEMLGALPANQQEVLRLKFQHGLSYREISRITRLTVSNVGFLIHTGLKTLREKMNAAGEASAAMRSSHS